MLDDPLKHGALLPWRLARRFVPDRGWFRLSIGDAFCQAHRIDAELILVRLDEPAPVGSAMVPLKAQRARLLRKHGEACVIDGRDSRILRLDEHYAVALLPTCESAHYAGPIFVAA
jgi:hypothetical protein